MILIIDNYDSFTFNLYQYVGMFEKNVQVFRNDAITLDEIEKLNPSHVILSPGPGEPRNAGITESVIKRFNGRIPILGICLGHQAIGEAFGGAVIHSPEGPIHGKQEDVHVASGCPIFNGLPPIVKAARYHSLVLDEKSLPDSLVVIAENNNGLIMGVAHRECQTFGLQFHPESILTEYGSRIIGNFLKTGGI